MSRLTQDSALPHPLARTGLSPSAAAISNAFRFASPGNPAVLLPRRCRNNGGLGCSPFARRYSGNHVCFLLLQVLRCFSSLRLPALRHAAPSTRRVSPFGHPRIKGHLHLPAVFRSLSRRLLEPRHPPYALIYLLDS